MTEKNYSKADTEKLLELYRINGSSDIPIIAKELGRTEKSVIAKLCHLKVYVPASKLSKQKTKKEIVQQIEKMLKVQMLGIEAASKGSLEILFDALKARLE